MGFLAGRNGLRVADDEGYAGSAFQGLPFVAGVGGLVVGPGLAALASVVGKTDGQILGIDAPAAKRTAVGTP